MEYTYANVQWPEKCIKFRTLVRLRKFDRMKMKRETW